jgi:transposase
MPANGVTIRKMKEILRLYYDANLSMHQIAKSLSISSGVVHKYIKRSKELNISWPLPENITNDSKLKELFQPPPSKLNITTVIDYQAVHTECKRKGVTLQLLWEEYHEARIITLGYSQFCRRYRAWLKTQPSSMKQTHKAGDKTFIDYSGMTFDIIDPATGEIRSTEIFIGVLGASNYTYAEATWSQQLPDWIASHVRMFEYFGGASALLVPDNLKSAVTKACRYDPDVNPTYAEMVSHYNTAVLPARPYRPKDKSKAEGSVLLVQRWILARLRNETFVGLFELNQAIKKWLKILNNKPFKKIPGCREELFESLDKPQLIPLPKIKYEYKAYKHPKVHVDYHVEIDGHYYSVPYKHVGDRLDVWYNNNVVECFYQSKQIAIHQYSELKGKHTTLTEHMPKSHQKKSEWSKPRFLNWASNIGINTHKITEHILDSKTHEEQGFRACLGFLGLSKKYTPEKLEQACEYAILNNVKIAKSVKTILQKEIYKHQNIGLTINKPITHDNIRGSEYYH